MRVFSFVIPLLILALFIACFIKKVPVYDVFCRGAKKTLPLIYSLFPYFIGIFLLTEIFEISGISNFIIKVLSPVFKRVGIPPELTPLIVLKPFSGSGSLSTLSNIFSSYGADSYVARCASCIYGSSETVFYVSSVYFASCKNKKLLKPILISLVASLCSCLVACLVCKFI